MGAPQQTPGRIRVPRVVSGVSPETKRRGGPTGLRVKIETSNGNATRRSRAFGETPNATRGTRALPGIILTRAIPAGSACLTFDYWLISAR